MRGERGELVRGKERGIDVRGGKGAVGVRGERGELVRGGLYGGGGCWGSLGCFGARG